MRKTLLTAAVACVMAVGGNGWANDPQKHGDKSAMNLKQVERDDVPEATLTAVTKKHPDAKVKSFSINPLGWVKPLAFRRSLQEGFGTMRV